MKLLALLRIAVELPARVAHLQARLERAEARIAELEEQAGDSLVEVSAKGGVLKYPTASADQIFWVTRRNAARLGLEPTKDQGYEREEES